jgi:hypothetical protein
MPSARQDWRSLWRAMPPGPADRHKAVAAGGEAETGRTAAAAKRRGAQFFYFPFLSLLFIATMRL